MRIDPLWNKVSNGPPWNQQGLFPSMSPLMLNHRRPPPTNPSAEIPGFVDLSLLIDTKWSVSLLMNLWNPVVTIYFIPNNFFQTVLPCLSLCLTWVLIKGPVMCLKCRHSRPADRTQFKGRQVGCFRSSLPCPVPSKLLVYTQAECKRWTKQTITLLAKNWLANRVVCHSFLLFGVSLWKEHWFIMFLCNK